MKYQVGDKIGRLTILSFCKKKEQNGKNRYYATCECECGTIKDIRVDSLGKEYKKTQSCGCYLRENHGKGNLRHGMIHTPTYKSWWSMKNRCFNKNAKGYQKYGAKGITVCDRWKDSFENFLEDMGERPSLKYSIDRIDVNGNYEPSNCRWATQKEQQNNRGNNIRLYHNGEEHTITEWASILGINPSAIRVRLRRGKTVEESLSTVDNRKYHFKK